MPSCTNTTANCIATLATQQLHCNKWAAHCLCICLFHCHCRLRGISREYMSWAFRICMIMWIYHPSIYKGLQWKSWSDDFKSFSTYRLRPFGPIEKKRPTHSTTKWPAELSGFLPKFAHRDDLIRNFSDWRRPPLSPPFWTFFPKFTTKIYRFEPNEICNVIFGIKNYPVDGCPKGCWTKLFVF